eukprot:6733031-Pyramimonas_sp.AAC.1
MPSPQAPEKGEMPRRDQTHTTHQLQYDYDRIRTLINVRQFLNIPGRPTQFLGTSAPRINVIVAS